MVFGRTPVAAALPTEALLSGLTRTWLADQSGRVLLSTWAITFVGVSARAFFQRRRKAKAMREQQAAAKAEAAAKDAKKGPAASPIKALLRRAIPGWGSRPVVWGCVLTIGIGLRIVVSIKVSSEIGVMGSLLAQRRWDELFKRQLGYALYGIPAAVLVAFQKYAAANVALALRSNLMGQVHTGLGSASSLPQVYRGAATAATGGNGNAATTAAAADGGARAQEEKNAVQLATGDVAAYCTEVVTLFEGLVKPALEVVILSSTLGSMMGTQPLLHCYGYFLLAGSWARFVSPSFATMTEAVQQAEGNLLDSHTRMSSYAEEITMLGGAPGEAKRLDEDLAGLRSAASHLSLQRFLSESLDGYVLRYLGILSAFTAMLPAVYHGIGARANADPTEYFLTCLHLLVNVGLALRDLVGSFKVAATARGYATRVETLYSAIDATPPVAAPPAGAGETLLQLEKLCVATPEGATLVQNLSLTLSKGQRILVRGPNGTGKSSILRVLAGVWPKSGGSITAMPPRAAVAFLPQRAYVPERHSVRAMLSYPQDPTATDDKLVAALRWVGLDELSGSLDAPVGKLSGGQEQRLQFARLILQPPSLAILDEATSNVEAAFEAKLFEWCASSNLALLTVSHNSAVAKYHTHELSLDADGRCTLRKL